MQMRTTLNLDENLLKEAMKSVGISEKTKLLHMGLEELVRKTARERLAKLYGKIKTAKTPSRRRIKA